MSAEWMRERLEQAQRDGEVVKLTGPRSVSSPGDLLTITDGTGRVWHWSDAWGGYRSPGMVTHGIETIRSQWGIA